MLDKVRTCRSLLSVGSPISDEYILVLWLTEEDRKSELSVPVCRSSTFCLFSQSLSTYYNGDYGVLEVLVLGIALCDTLLLCTVFIYSLDTLTRDQCQELNPRPFDLSVNDLTQSATQSCGKAFWARTAAHQLFSHCFSYRNMTVRLLVRLCMLAHIRIFQHNVVWHCLLWYLC